MDAQSKKLREIINPFSRPFKNLNCNMYWLIRTRMFFNVHGLLRGHEEYAFIKAGAAS